MNVEIQKTFMFSSVLDNTESSPWINSYEVRLKFKVITPDTHEYNIAYGRIKHWFDMIMQDAVLIEHSNERLAAWKNTGMKCMDFPIYPLDQVIGLMLISKLSAITEGRLEIQEIGVASPADDFLSYLCEQGDDLHWFEQPGWWNDTKLTYSTSAKAPKQSGKVISLPRADDWKEHNLDWNNAATNKGNVSMLPGSERDE